MKLNELLEREGFASVNDRTNISIDNLIKLVDNNFEELNRVKAIGFLSILKREYDGIELDDIEKGIKEYFEENTIDDDVQVLVTVEKKEKDSGIFKWIIIVALLGGLWYLYSNGKLGGNLSNTDSKENMLKDSEALQSSIMEESLEVKKDENKTEVEIQTSKTTPTIEENTSKATKVNDNVEAESNKTTESVEVKTEEDSGDKPKSSEDNKSEDTEIDKEIDNDETLLDKSTDEVIKSDEDSISTSTETIVNEDEKAEIIYNVTVNPRVNLWFGFINLDTKARKEFITTESTSIDVGEQRWVLITGHGRLSVASETSSLKINDSAKHYFYIDSSEIREVERAEFKELNDGRGW